MEAVEAKVSTRDGLSIFLRAWVAPEPERIVVCVQGLGGHGGYYAELAEHLGKAGTALVAPDLRGHGHSAGKRGDIDRFDRYLEDVEAAVIWARECWPGKLVILLGESMGASIAIQYTLQAAQQPATAPAGLILLAPVLRPAIQPSFSEAARFLRSLVLHPTRPTMPTSGREELGCRDDAFNTRLRADPLFVRHVSVRFLNTLTFWLWRTRRKASQVALPLLVIRGEQDRVAHPAGTAAFYRRVRATQRSFLIIPEAYHCLLYDPKTPAVVDALNAWLAEHTTAAQVQPLPAVGKTLLAE
ncbi:MAG TPA: alpha/beta fold hydrolase [Ktedonobacterales bacterium]|jgi:alpha-beta hydrolase superfamily lysophospholipase